MVAEKRAAPARPGSELERITAERDRLLADKRMAEWRDQRWRTQILAKECKKLQQQRDQLREALDELVRELDRIEPDPIEHQWMGSTMRANSLAALLDTKV